MLAAGQLQALMDEKRALETKLENAASEAFTYKQQAVELDAAQTKVCGCQTALVFLA